MGRKARIWVISKEESGKRLKFYRKRLGFTLERVCQSIGISPSALSQAERGEIYITKHYEAIAKLYGIRVEALMAEGQFDEEIMELFTKIAELRKHAKQTDGFAEFVLLQVKDQVKKALDKLNTEKH